MVHPALAHARINFITNPNLIPGFLPPLRFAYFAQKTGNKTPSPFYVFCQTGRVGVGSKRMAARVV